MCQISGGAQFPTLARIHAGDTSVESELAGLIFSLEALKTQRAPVEQGVMYSDFFFGKHFLTIEGTLNGNRPS